MTGRGLPHWILGVLLIHHSLAVLGPPQEVSFYATPSSLEVSWVPPRTKILGYQVYYTPVSAAEGLDPSLWGYVEVWGRVSDASVSGVSSDLKYLVAVKTVGRDHVESDFSDIVGESSQATVNPPTESHHQVHNLRVISSGVDYLGLAWEPPQDGVMVKLYQVLYYPVFEPLDAEYQNTPIPLVALDALSRDTAYRIAVKPLLYAGAGWGTAVFIEYRTQS